MIKLACSSLAWAPNRPTQSALASLRRAGYTGIEVAPTRIWGSWENATPQNTVEFRQMLTDEGFTVPALQSIFYGLQGVNLFLTPDVLEQHVRVVARVAADLNSPVLVMGAPQMRRLAGLERQQAFGLAVLTLQRWAQICHDQGVCLCIEPNPREYGCEFIWTVEQAVDLVRAVDHPGFGLHVDAGAMHMESEVGPEIIRRHITLVRHFHVSEPHLRGLFPNQVDHLANLFTLVEHGYQKWVSLETTETETFDISIHRLKEWADTVKEGIHVNV